MQTIINNLSIVPTPIGVSLAPDGNPYGIEVCVSVDEAEGTLTVNIYQYTEGDNPIATHVVELTPISE